MRAQTERAVAEADRLILLVDAPCGPHAAGSLRRPGNAQAPASRRPWPSTKSEGLDLDLAAADFHALGLGEPLGISASHGQGCDELMTQALAGLEAGIGKRGVGCRRRGSPHRHHRPAQRRQVHARQPPDRRGARHRERSAGHDPRQHPRAVRARRAQVPTHRYRRHASPRQSRGCRSSGRASRRRCRRSMRRTW